LMNFLIKTASQPFNILGNIAGSNPESIETIPFRFLQDSLDVGQKKNLNKIASILNKKKELIFTFTQETNLKKEKELLALKACVRSFCISMNIAFPDVVGEQILDWGTGNLEFMAYLKSNTNLEEVTDIPLLCIQMIGQAELDQKFLNLLRIRNSSLNAFMKDSLGLEYEAFEVKTADLRNMPDQLKSPNYRVEVSLK